MSYNAFTVEQVFKNNDANAACNLIYTSLQGATIPITDFMLTGTPARIVQGAPLTEVSVIPFITDIDSVFVWCQNNIEKLFGVGVLVYPDKLEFIWQNIYFEIWLVLDAGLENNITGLIVQDTANIPLNIL